MAPLLLHPLLIGYFEVENDFDVGGDNSIQLLQAAVATNHAQAIIITLLEEYYNIFKEGSSSPGPDMYMDSKGGSESAEATNDDFSYDYYYDDEQDESIEGSNVDVDDDLVSETNENGDSVVNDEYGDKDHILSYSSSKSLEATDIIEGLFHDQTTMNRLNYPSSSSCMNKSIAMSNGTMHQRRTVLGRNSGSKNLSMESIDILNKNKAEVERLEAVKTEMQIQIAAKEKEALQEPCLVIERDVNKLQEQLLKEKNFMETLEAGPKFLPGTLSKLIGIDEKTKTEFEKLVTIDA
ncbi:hypothetical protein RYX36_026010 [Vicia faba]